MPAPLLLLVALAVTPETLDAIRVTQRRPAADASASVSRLDEAALRALAATHPNEVAARVPGAWISRGSGQEQLTAIRSPVLAGSGACGAFLLLDDGVPMRPAGLCNVNQLFELDTEQGGALEVLRGPGTAVHGSNALHGVIDLRPAPIDGARARLALERGSDDYERAQLALGDARRWRVDALGVSAGSFRVDESHDQQKLVAQWQAPDAPGAPRLRFAASNLNQETAGFVSGRDAYRDARRRANQNPEAFRDAQAQRVQGRWQFVGARGELELVPYARHDTMEFLQHFAPGKPLERNGSRSGGLQAMWRPAARWDWQLGVDVEGGRGTLLESQPQPLREGSAAQQAIRPAGRHYDYAVSTRSAAAFVQLAVPLAAHTTLDAGLRAEVLRYGYDNRMAAGNARDDGSACAFGGCLFNRPADRDDRFDGIAAQLGLQHDVGARTRAFARVAHAFRFPQAGELYRLQRGQDVADLAPETLDALELGLRGAGAAWRWDLAAYAMRKRDVILRDAFGFNLSDGRTRHRGIELDASWTFAPQWTLSGNASHALHRYAFSRALAGGETIVAGDEIDTAPRRLAGLRLAHDASRAGRIELEGVHVGSYFVDAANTARQPSHTLWHLRWQRDVAPQWRVGARLMNLGDRRYAERADLAFGEFRYFPGAGRSLFLTLEWSAAR